MKSYTKIIAFILILLNSLPSKAEEQPSKFESVIAGFTWSPVAGNSGYILQIRNSSQVLIHEIKVPAETLKVELPPGDYTVRLAALNRFKKPAVWTPWNSFTLTGYVKEQPVSAGKEEMPAEPAEKTDRSLSFFKWSHFIPGATRIRNGQYITGGLWSVPFAAAAYSGYKEKQFGDLQAKDPFNNPVYLSIITASQPESFLLAGMIQRNSNRADYNRHQQNQRNIAWGALALYLIQYGDAVWSDYRFQKSVKPSQSFLLMDSGYMPTVNPFSQPDIFRIGLTIPF